MLCWKHGNKDAVDPFRSLQIHASVVDHGGLDQEADHIYSTAAGVAPVAGIDVGLLLPGTKPRMKKLNCHSASPGSFDFLLE